MAFKDKLSAIAATVGEKAGDAIESGKIAIKIKEEERKMDNNAERIGKIIIDKLDNGEEMEEGIMELYALIKQSREAIEALRAEQAANVKAE